jgi:hypothetical protein
VCRERILAVDLGRTRVDVLEGIGISPIGDLGRVEPCIRKSRYAISRRDLSHPNSRNTWQRIPESQGSAFRSLRIQGNLSCEIAIRDFPESI